MSLDLLEKLVDKVLAYKLAKRDAHPEERNRKQCKNELKSSNHLDNKFERRGSSE